VTVSNSKRGNNRLQLVGKKFGRLTVVENVGSDKKWQQHWKCTCDCGTEIVVIGGSLTSGNTKSCGCVGREKRLKHGLFSGCKKGKKWPPEVRTYYKMRVRCLDPKYPQYKDYGGRGIKVCDRWLGEGGLHRFLEDMGNKPSKNHSLDRINNEGNYEPSNCRWATRLVQNRNSRHNVNVEFEGRTMCINAWAEYFGVVKTTFQGWRRKWGIEEALKRGKAAKEKSDQIR
jgi:hypothetical protein